jgi:phage terminase large subunit
VDGNILKANFPEKLGVLFHPHRYKVVYGGRGGGRSWGCARALLLKAIITPTRVLCAREIQKSIRDSVHKLLSDQIQHLGISPMFEIQEAVIKVKNGGEFTFSGLSTQTIESIKSMEGVDYVWAEEAHIITKRSWDILIPTIRKDGSEIWITFNPSLETDETYQRFVISPPPDTAIVKLDYHDNPWFPEVLEKERLYCLEDDPENYANIWEGTCKPAVEGAIYYHEVQKAEKEGRICNVPYDPMLKVHIVMDLGWNDAMAISLVQKHASELRIIEYIEDSHKTLDYYSSMLKEKRLNWGKVWLPHDGYSRDFKTGKSTEEIIKKLGWIVPKKEEIIQLSVEDGIRLVRMTFGRIYFDREKAARPLKIESQTIGHHRLLECIKRYRRSVSRETQEPGSPLHDAFSHGADNLRYICANVDQMSNEDGKPRVYHRGYGILDAVVGY